MAPADFSPRFFEDGSGLYYEDGHVLAAVDIAEMSCGGRSLLISEWSSHTRGAGHTTRALEWLRPQFKVIGANRVGEQDDEGVWDIATYYWAHMVRKGLVDELFDDLGQALLVGPDGTVRVRSWPVAAAPEPVEPPRQPRRRRP